MYRYFKRRTSIYRYRDTGTEYWNHMLNEWQKSSRYTPEEYLNGGYSELTESQARDIFCPPAFAEQPEPAGEPKLIENYHE